MLQVSPLRDDLKDKFAEMFETYYKELGYKHSFPTRRSSDLWTNI